MEPAGCCCCFGLRRGSFAIGITQLVLYSLPLLAVMISIAGISASGEMDEGAAVGLELGLIAVLAIHVTFNSLLVHGALRDRKGMVLAWVIYQGVALSVQGLVAISSFLTAGIAGSLPLVVIIQVSSATMAPLWYWFAVGIRHYKELRKQPGFVYSRELDDKV